MRRAGSGYREETILWEYQTVASLPRNSPRFNRRDARHNMGDNARRAERESRAIFLYAASVVCPTRGRRDGERSQGQRTAKIYLRATGRRHGAGNECRGTGYRSGSTLRRQRSEQSGWGIRHRVGHPHINDGTAGVGAETYEIGRESEVEYVICGCGRVAPGEVD